MHKSEQGFTHVVVLLVALLLVAGSGYIVYANQHKTKTDMVSTTTSKTNSGSLAVPANEPKTAAGVADAVNTLATSLINNESALNSTYTASDQTSDASVGTAATNLGGAYDANNY